MGYLASFGRFPVAVLATAILVSSAVSAQPQAASASAVTEQARQPAPEPITRYSLPPEKQRAAVALARAGHELYFGDFAVSILLLVLLLRFRVVARYGDWAEQVSRWRVVQAALFALLLLVTLDLASLPFHIGGHTLALRYNLSVERWPSWFADQAKSEFISVVIGTLLIWVANALIRRQSAARHAASADAAPSDDGAARRRRRRWWIAMWLISVPLVIFAVFIDPLVIEPMFYEFRPLAISHAELTGKIRQVAAHAGLEIPQERIFEMLASRKLNELNAYVTGVGASKRVVIWDTLLRSMDDGEVLAVFGHELGHYVLGHVWKGVVLGLASLALGLWLVARMLDWTLARWGAWFGIRSQADWAALALVWLFLSLLSFASTPAANAVSRYLEHQADVFGLEVIHGVVPNAPQVAARTNQILGEVDLEQPSPSRLEVFWFYDHPPVARRLDFALHYDPWGEGQKPEFIGR